MEDFLGSSPIGSAPLYACARPNTYSRPHPKAQVRLVTAGHLCRGFGTCGCIGVVTPKPFQPRRSHGGTGPRCRGPSQGPRPLVPGQDLPRLRSTELLQPPWLTRKPVLKVRALRHLLHDGEGGPRAGLSRPRQPSRQPDASNGLHWLHPYLARARALEEGHAGPVSDKPT